MTDAHPVELPAPDEPEVQAAIARLWDARRALQRPLVGVAGCLASAVITVALWEQLYGRAGGQLPWLVDAGLASFLGAAVGLGMRTGKVVDRPWLALAGVVGFAAATLGDLGAALRFVMSEHGIATYGQALAALGGVGGMLAARTPLDWFVAGLAGLLAGLLARPFTLEAQILAEAQDEVLAREALEAMEEP